MCLVEMKNTVHSYISYCSLTITPLLVRPLSFGDHCHKGEERPGGAVEVEHQRELSFAAGFQYHKYVLRLYNETVR